jgi:hypothetical protein
LILEVIHLREQKHDFEIRLLLSEQNYQLLLSAHTGMVERNEKRYDDILERQFGSNVQRPVNGEQHLPIKMRQSWKQTAASFEAKDRQEYWKQKVKDIEDKTAAAMNAKETK